MSEVDILIPCYKNIEEIRLLLISLKEQENIKINKIGEKLDCLITNIKEY